MDEVSKDFITQFHNLPGESLTEKQQNLFHLFRNYQSLLLENEEELGHVLTNLKPSTHLEKIFHLDFLIFFRRAKEFYQEIEDGNEIALTKINKQNWFFKAAFEGLKPEQFVTDTMPRLSSAAKVKILKNLPISEEEGDEIFEAVSKRYGIFLAVITLTKCSATKIGQVLKSKQIKLTLAQLKIIYNKDPNLVSIYLEERTRHEGNSAFMNKNRFFVFLARNNPSMFSELYEKYKFETSLGRKTTVAFINSQRNIVLTNLELYAKILNLSSLVKILGNELATIFFKKNPNNRSELYWKSLLKYYPKRQRFELYKSTYDATHHNKFGENTEAISEDVLGMIPDPELREKFAKLKLEKEEDEVYLKYVNSKYCLNEFMEKLNNMTLFERIKYVKIVTNCALLNSDLDTLLKICELVATRFKNDDKKLRYEFFSAFGWDNKIFDKLTEQHWQFIMQIMAIIRANQEWVWNERAIRFKYLEYLIINDKPLKEIISKYSDWIDQMPYESRVWRNLAIYKRVLSELIEVGLPNKATSSKREAALYDCNLTYVCQDYNKKNPEDVINIYQHPRILQSIKYAIENDTFTHTHSSYSIGIENVICRKSSSKELEYVKKAYFKFFKPFGGLKACLWFLKHEPKPILENFEQFLPNFLEIWTYNDNKLWRFIKKYSHLELNKRTVEFCTRKLEDNKGDTNRIARILSIVTPPETHLEYIKTLVPPSSESEEKGTHLVICALLKYLHMIQSPKDVLDVALDFCKGDDYLKFALGPLYNSIYKLPESEAKSLIEKIGQDEDVAFKRHAAHLSSLIFDEDMICVYLQNANLTSTLKYFARNPSDNLWEIVSQKLLNIQPHDKHLLKHAMKVKIPPKYRSRYLEIVIDKSDTAELKKNLLEQVKDIQKLDPQVDFRIIESSIFKIEDVNEFIAKLLIHTLELDPLAKILNEFKENSWKKDRNGRRKLYRFIQSLLKTYMNVDEPNLDFADEFLRIFKLVFQPSETFEEFVMILCLKLKGETMENCGKLLNEFNKEMIGLFGTFVTNLFINVVSKDVLPLVCKSDHDKIELCYCMFNDEESVDYLLVIGLLPKREPEDVRYFSLYNEMLSKFEQTNDNVVQLQYNLYLKSEIEEPDSPEFKDRCFLYRC